MATSEKLVYVVEGCCMFVSQTDINGNKECKRQCLQLKKNKQETSNCFTVWEPKLFLFEIQASKYIKNESPGFPLFYLL